MNPGFLNSSFNASQHLYIEGGGRFSPSASQGLQSQSQQMVPATPRVSSSLRPRRIPNLQEVPASLNHSLSSCSPSPSQSGDLRKWEVPTSTPIQKKPDKPDETPEPDNHEDVGDHTVPVYKPSTSVRTKEEKKKLQDGNGDKKPAASSGSEFRKKLCERRKNFWKRNLSSEIETKPASRPPRYLLGSQGNDE